MSVTVRRAYGVGPVSVMVTVKVTCWPGTAWVASAVWVMLRAGIWTATLTEQAGPGDPAGQLLPSAAVDSVLASVLSPVPGLFTVTVPVTVTDRRPGCSRSRTGRYW